MSDELGYKKLEIGNWRVKHRYSSTALLWKSCRNLNFTKPEAKFAAPQNPFRANIVEGYGKRTWKADFIRHLRYALGSCDETIDHLETLWETNSLKDETNFKTILELLDHLKRKLVNFTRAVETGHKTDW